MKIWTEHDTIMDSGKSFQNFETVEPDKNFESLYQKLLQNDTISFRLKTHILLY